MRNLGAVPVVFLVACGSSSQPSGTAPPPTPPDKVAMPPKPVARPAAGKLVDDSKDEPDALTFKYMGRGVSLADVPAIAEKLGLPVSGKADFSIDVIVPKTRGEPDYTKATGRIDLACTKCQIGDDVAKLQLASKNPRAAAFAPGGIAFGHLAIDHFEAKLEIIGGKLEMTSWKLESPDVDLQSSLAVTFSRTLDGSALEGCLRYKPTEALQERDPKTHDVLLLTGAQRGADGYDHIALAGTVGQVRKLARECTASL